MFRHWHTFSLLFFLSFFSTAQDHHPIIESFTANETDGEVYLSWSIFGGNTCNGIFIERSNDSINYIEIGEIQGICGSVDFSIAYDFTDRNPVANANNYYRLSLGGQGESLPIKIHYLDVSNGGYFIYPNPISTQGTLNFDNQDQDDFSFQIHDLRGKRVYYQDGIREETILVDGTGLQKGIYIFTLLGSRQQKISGRLVIN